ncbi:YrrS family protein [Bacillus sp. MCCB 382]|uniref:YrrS family protein n=1 Tax=Bacillus sp. MCCB 382 TaxID=2860197 RepID=UPI001C575578|nr:YrrS family protein [Bacillus sp. MCCB 382]
MAKYQSRLDKRSKKNTNKILNIMIAVVLLLIVVVGGTIVFGGGGDEKATTDAPKNSETKDAKSDKSAKEKQDSDKSVSMEENSDTEDKADEEQKENDKKKEDEQKKDETSDDNNESVALDDSKMKVEEGDGDNVEKTMVHPDWKPIGTEQSGDHVSSYETGTTDWQEKIKAVSYATGISEDNMTVWWMEGNGGPQKSMATVTAKDTKTPYRVYLQWVDGKGWQPTKVQELKENDKD